MPFHYTIDADARVVLSTALGILSSDEVDRHRKFLSADSNFDPDFAHLIDLVAVTDVELKSADIRSLTETRAFNPTSKTALVGDRDLLYGMSRAFQSWRDNDGYTEVFRTMQEARLWLAQD